MKKSRFLFRTPFLLLLCLILGSGFAQSAFDGAAITGTISGTLGDAEHSWNSFELQVPDGVQNTASYYVLMEVINAFSLQGHRDGQLTEGAVSISFDFFGEPFVDCPCQFTGEVNHWTTSSMFADLYVDSEATITVLEAVALVDGAYSLVGTAEGELLFHESAFSSEATGEPVPFLLSFDIQLVTPEQLDLD